MAPASINDLPIELHTSILKFLLSLSRPVIPIHCEAILESGYILPSYHVIPDWTEKYIQSTSHFPFNVASVSKLWCNILALIPECWTHIILDVAKDPTPFLEAFSWSKNLENIEVMIFNSADALKTDEIRENLRVASITRALQPHIRRCKSIIFNLSYSASLPSPTIFLFEEAPRLEVLVLNCSIDNIDLQSEPRDNYKKYGDQQILSTSFPRLTQLSLTGFWFMYLIMHADKFIGPDCINYQLAFTISHFKFPRNGCYSLQEFVFYISSIGGVGSLYFQDLSLAYAYDSLHQEPDFTCKIHGDIHFQSVSKDFLDHLYIMARISISDTLSFEACQIPKIKQTQYSSILTLTNIIDDDKGSSLRHILEAWDGKDLAFRYCHSFNNVFLSWFASEIKYAPIDPDSHDTFPAEGMASLNITCCDNFTSYAVKELIRLRFEAARANGFVCCFNLFVTASVSGPMLRDEDKGWFEQNKNMTVNWKVRDDEGTKEVFRTKSLYR